VTPEGSRVKLSRDGIEKIEFLISTNLGENFRPLVKVASGGEISRIMLSIKNILRRLDPIETLIFDEIDAGIGGETAFAVGKKLKEISTDKQVLCITHLAQIASMGEHHYKVVKTEEANRTKTQIFALNEEERIREISRMLSGDQITDITIEHAKQFLESNLG
jgi:DNA repair protein RecN (Recombination protein N)